MGKTATEFLVGANVFADAFRVLNTVGQAGVSQVKGAESKYELLGRMYIPSIVLQAFTAELYLKALITNEGKQIKKIHKLNELFDMLSETEKEIITANMVSQIREDKRLSESKYAESELREDFAKAANTFEDWRYFFENGTVSSDTVFLKVLTDVLYERCKSLIN